jgi:hypothetical protein
MAAARNMQRWDMTCRRRWSVCPRPVLSQPGVTKRWEVGTLELTCAIGGAAGACAGPAAWSSNQQQAVVRDPGMCP